LNVLNKADRLAEPLSVMGEHNAMISARTGAGLPDMLRKIAALLPLGSRRLKMLIPYDQGGLVAEIRREGKVFSEEFVAQGTLLDAMVAQKLINKTQGYVVE